MNNLPKRKHPRLKGYDYSQNGAYFVTICAKDKQHMFGEIKDNAMRFSRLGKIAYDEIWNISRHRENVEILHAVVMPNHVHLLLMLHGEMLKETWNTNSFGKPQARSLSMVVGAYKAAVTRNFRKYIDTAMTRNFQERTDTAMTKNFQECTDTAMTKNFQECTDTAMTRNFQEHTDTAMTRNFQDCTDTAMTSHGPTAIDTKIWQNGYYDHIVRGDADFRRIWTYIDENPIKWQSDCYYVP